MWYTMYMWWLITTNSVGVGVTTVPMLYGLYHGIHCMCVCVDTEPHGLNVRARITTESQYMKR